MDDGRISNHGIAASESCLSWVDLRPALLIKGLQEEPFKDLAEHADNRDWSEVVGVPSLLWILAEEVDLGLIPNLGSVACLHAEDKEILQQGHEAGPDKCFEQPNMDAIGPTTLLARLALDLSDDRVYREEGLPDGWGDVRLGDVRLCGLLGDVRTRGGGRISGVPALEDLEVLCHGVEGI